MNVKYRYIRGDRENLLSSLGGYVTNERIVGGLVAQLNPNKAVVARSSLFTKLAQLQHNGNIL